MCRSSTPSGDAAIQISGELGRISAAVVGHLIAANTAARGAAAGGTSSDRRAATSSTTPSFANPKACLTALDLSDNALGDRGGAPGALLQQMGASMAPSRPSPS